MNIKWLALPISTQNFRVGMIIAGLNGYNTYFQREYKVNASEESWRGQSKSGELQNICHKKSQLIRYLDLHFGKPQHLH